MDEPEIDLNNEIKEIVMKNEDKEEKEEKVQ